MTEGAAILADNPLDMAFGGTAAVLAGWRERMAAAQGRGTGRIASYISAGGHALTSGTARLIPWREGARELAAEADRHDQRLGDLVRTLTGPPPWLELIAVTAERADTWVDGDRAREQRVRDAIRAGEFGPTARTIHRILASDAPPPPGPRPDRPSPPRPADDGPRIPAPAGDGPWVQGAHGSTEGKTPAETPKPGQEGHDRRPRDERPGRRERPHRDQPARHDDRQRTESDRAAPGRHGPELTSIQAIAMFHDPDSGERQFLVRDDRGGWRVEPEHGDGTAESPRWNEVKDPEFGRSFLVREAGGQLSFVDSRRVPQMIDAQPSRNPWADTPKGEELLDRVLTHLRRDTTSGAATEPIARPEHSNERPATDRPAGPDGARAGQPGERPADGQAPQHPTDRGTASDAGRERHQGERPMARQVTERPAARTQERDAGQPRQPGERPIRPPATERPPDRPRGGDAGRERQPGERQSGPRAGDRPTGRDGGSGPHRGREQGVRPAGRDRGDAGDRGQRAGERLGDGRRGGDAGRGRQQGERSGAKAEGDKRTPSERADAESQSLKSAVQGDRAGRWLPGKRPQGERSQLGGDGGKRLQGEWKGTDGDARRPREGGRNR